MCARILEGSAALRELVRRLADGRGAFALAETVSASRPALLAALYTALGRQMLVVVPTPDMAERTFADLTFFLADDALVALFRSRDESIAALESPSERAARMALFAQLVEGRPQLIVASVAALRQFVLPPRTFASLEFVLTPQSVLPFEDIVRRLYVLGYRRTDTVSAAGEYAVRGGIVDVFSPTADTATRLEFFGDRIESMRSFDLQSQRSTGAVDALTIAPWSEIPRNEALRQRIIARHHGRGAVAQALQAYLASGQEIPEAWVSLAHDERATVLDYFARDAILVFEEPSELATIEQSLTEERTREEELLLAASQSGELDISADEINEALLAEVAAPYPRLDDLAAELSERCVLAFPGAIEGTRPAWLPSAAQTFVEPSMPAEHFNRQIEMFLQALRQWSEGGERVALVTSGAARLRELLDGAGLRDAGAVEVFHGTIEAGFSLPRLHLRVLGDSEIFGQPPKRVKLRAVKEGVPVTLSELRVGDHVVHAVHGVGRYVGLRTETVLNTTSDYLDLRFAGSDRLLVPVHQMHYVTRYAASDGAAPRLSKMGGADWARAKGRVSAALAKIADGLVELYAERELSAGHAFAPDTPWQGELEEAFPYDETPDQLRAIEETKSDMQRPRPMDRLVCGDVGYGKTEVAVRAAFKAIADGRQVAILVPTTLLASQHYRTFSTRFAAYPIRVEELSRFRTRGAQQTILSELAAGNVDLVIGTHRLLQKDVVFRRLGLIVVDEEQRFGVMHKERLKELRASVDVLTLSATPIPRTLQMSLLGVRELSLIQTPPKNRVSIKTVVVPASDAMVQRAITTELDRGGQVYYVHNRIESIYAVARALEKLVPKARVAIGHGKMPEAELAPVMGKFIDGELDIFVSTTIIENGIDIPNVNTIIVNDADTFGLAQLYQLRGRVGRSNHQAYAYLLYQPHKMLGQEAKARLEAIREFTHLGSGLQVAMRDLEIRGAGNLLGAAQSGFIGAVGFDTYCQLLAEAIAQRKGQAREDEPGEAVIDVKVDAFIPNDYIAQPSHKIAVYQQLANARTLGDVEHIAAGLKDRFGPLPAPLRNLVAVTELRAIALSKRVTRVVIGENRLTLGVGSGFALSPAALPQLQRLSKNRFRFDERKIVVDLPHAARAEWLPLVRSFLDAL